MKTAELGKTSQMWLKGLNVLMSWFFRRIHKEVDCKTCHGDTVLAFTRQQTRRSRSCDQTDWPKIVVKMAYCDWTEEDIKEQNKTTVLTGIMTVVQ